MQPYFLPYGGYFQLISAVDVFIVYDNVKYTKRGWINRNRFLLNGKDAVFSLPLKGDSDLLDIRERTIAPDFDPDRLLRRIDAAYHGAPERAATMPLLEAILRYEDRNLFRFVHHSLSRTCAHLGIGTPIRISSEIPVDHELRHQDRVLALVAAAGASEYVNAIGGTELYSASAFRARGIELKFIRSRPFEYRQFDGAFVPDLSIVDMLMFNPIAAVRACVESNFELIDP